VSFFAVVSFFTEVSIFILVVVSESAPPVVVLPLQAENETAIAKANTLSLNVFFMLVFLK